MAETEQNDAAIEADAAATARIDRLTRNTAILVAVALAWYLLGDRFTPSTSVARVSGKVVPIVPEVTGTVVAVNVALNQAVAAGDLLVEIDPEDYERAVAKAEAQLARAVDEMGAETGGVAAAEARLSSAQTQLTAALRDERRITKLEAAGVASEFRADNARSRREKAEAALETARAELEAARSQSLGFEMLGSLPGWVARPQSTPKPVLATTPRKTRPGAMSSAISAVSPGRTLPSAFSRR